MLSKSPRFWSVWWLYNIINHWTTHAVDVCWVFDNLWRPLTFVLSYYTSLKYSVATSAVCIVYTGLKYSVATSAVLTVVYMFHLIAHKSSRSVHSIPLHGDFDTNRVSFHLQIFWKQKISLKLIFNINIIYIDQVFVDRAQRGVGGADNSSFRPSVYFEIITISNNVWLVLFQNHKSVEKM